MEGLQALEENIKRLSVRITYGEAILELFEKEEKLLLKFHGKKPYEMDGEIEFTTDEVISFLFGAIGIEKVKIDKERYSLIVEYLYDKELLKVKINDREEKKFTRYYLNPPHHVFLLSTLRNYVLKLEEVSFSSGIFRVEIDRNRKSLELYEGNILILERKGRDFKSLRAVLENSFIFGEIPFKDKLSRCIFFKEKKLPTIALKVWSVI